MNIQKNVNRQPPKRKLSVFISENLTLSLPLTEHFAIFIMKTAHYMQ
jgi:hypothetical protein